MQTMYRRKEETRFKLDKLKQECQINFELQSKLLCLGSKYANGIENLDDADLLRNYSKYYLAVTKFFDYALQLILETNINLESFMLENNDNGLENQILYNLDAKSDITRSISVCSTRLNLNSVPLVSNNLPRLENGTNAVNFAFYNAKIDNTVYIAPNATNYFKNLKDESIENTSSKKTVNEDSKKNFYVPDTNESKDNIILSCETADIPNCDTQNVPTSFSQKTDIISPSVLTVKAEIHESPSSEKSVDLIDFNSLIGSDVSVNLDVDVSESVKESRKDIDLQGNMSIEAIKQHIKGIKRSGAHLIMCENEQSAESSPPDVDNQICKLKPPHSLFDIISKASDEVIKNVGEISRIRNYSKSPVDTKTPKSPVSTNKISNILLNGYTFVSRKEKYEQTMPKVNMPNLALKLSKKRSRISDLRSVETNSGSDDVSVVDVSKERQREETVVTNDNDHTSTRKQNTVEKNVFDLIDRPTPKTWSHCHISHVESPSEFYIQILDEEIALLDLTGNQIEELYSNTILNCLSKEEAITYLGRYCIAYLENTKSWYRVEVIDWLKKSEGMRKDEVLIQLVDYGNYIYTSYGNLRKLYKEFSYIRKVAQRCHLACLYPPGSTANRLLPVWPEECTEGFKNVADDKTIFKLVFVGKEGKSLSVDFINTSESNDENSVGQVLIDSGLAVQILVDVPSLVPKGCRELSSDVPEDQMELYFGNEKYEEVEDVNEMVMHYNPRDEALTCPYQRSDGTCFKGRHCRLRHVQLSKHGFTADKIPIFLDVLTQYDLPQAENVVLLKISHISDIQKFYAQICRPEYENPDYYGMTLNKLKKLMNKPDVIKKYKHLRDLPNLGQMVIAKHWDNHWYRAQVRDCVLREETNDYIIQIFVVDFGDVLDVTVSDIRLITEEYLHLPFQAVECRLANVKHKNGADPKEEKEYFESIYLCETVKAKIISLQQHLQVLLLDHHDNDIGLKLIEAGYGELNEDQQIPCNNEAVLID